MPGRQRDPDPLFDPERAEALLEAIRDHGLNRAFRTAKVTQRTVTAWLERGKSERAEDAAYRGFLKPFGRAIRDREARRSPPDGE